MIDFKYIHNPYSNQWVILAPNRAHRPDQIAGDLHICPFCPGNEAKDVEVYRIPTPRHLPGVHAATWKESLNWTSDWIVRVVKNKYPITEIHEVIIHSPDHHKNFDELPLGQTELVFQTYRQRYNTHKDAGNITILHNFGEVSGASITHPHSQLIVTPKEISLDVPPIPIVLLEGRDSFKADAGNTVLSTDHFDIFCPMSSQWPDEVWVVSQNTKITFGEVTEDELHDLSFTVARLIQILDIRHGHDFSFNFYISAWRNWYLRIIPRQKKIGGFELGTNIYVNTQDPSETFAFIKEHFHNPDREKILAYHRARYHRGV